MVSFTQLLTLLAASAAVASPVPVPADEDVDFSASGPVNATDATLEARQQGGMYICRSGANNDGQVYGTVSYDRAIGYLREAGTKAGASGYPKPFGNAGGVMKFASGCASGVYELPLLDKGARYDFDKKKTNNSPGPIRVYYTSGLKFCGIGAKETASGAGNPHNCEQA